MNAKDGGKIGEEIVEHRAGERTGKRTGYVRVGVGRCGKDGKVYHGGMWQRNAEQ